MSTASRPTASSTVFSHDGMPVLACGRGCAEWTVGGADGTREGAGPVGCGCAWPGAGLLGAVGAGWPGAEPLAGGVPATGMVSRVPALIAPGSGPMTDRLAAYSAGQPPRTPKRAAMADSVSPAATVYRTGVAGPGRCRTAPTARVGVGPDPGPVGRVQRGPAAPDPEPGRDGGQGVARLDDVGASRGGGRHGRSQCPFSPEPTQRPGGHSNQSPADRRSGRVGTGQADVGRAGTGLNRVSGSAWTGGDHAGRQDGPGEHDAREFEPRMHGAVTFLPGRSAPGIAGPGAVRHEPAERKATYAGGTSGRNERQMALAPARRARRTTMRVRWVRWSRVERPDSGRPPWPPPLALPAPLPPAALPPVAATGPRGVAGAGARGAAVRRGQGRAWPTWPGTRRPGRWSPRWRGPGAAALRTV